jgi:hypothetical protein
MRYIIYLLLAANALYLGWNLSHGETVVQVERLLPAIPRGARSLVMLHEIAGNKVPEKGREDSTETGKQAGQQTDELEGAMADLDAGQVTDRVTATALALVAHPDSRPAQVCKTLGPFNEFAAAESVSDRLVDMGLIPVLRSVDSRVVDDYWVYLPGKGRQYSRKVIQQLKSKKINDYYVFDSDDYLISLGIFRKIGLAEKRQTMLRQMGLDAVLVMRSRTQVEHWLEMSIEGKYDEQLKSIAMETPGLQINTSSCASLAAQRIASVSGSYSLQATPGTE